LTLVLISNIEIWKKFSLPKLFLFRKRENSHYFLKLNIHFTVNLLFSTYREKWWRQVYEYLYIYMYIHVQVKVEPITMSVNICMYVKNRFLLLIMSSSVVVSVIDDKNAAFYITPFALEIAYIWWEKKMMIGRSRQEVGDDVCTHTSSAFVFRLRCALLSLSLCLSSSFLKTACAQAHHMCYRRTHPFFFFFSLLCSTCSIIILHIDVCARRKKTNREREREEERERKT